MIARAIEDAESIEAYLRRDPALHLYEIGDLDPFFRERVTFFGAFDPDLTAVCTLFRGGDPPTLLGLDNDRPDRIAALVDALADTLPDRYCGQFTPGVVDRLRDRYDASDPLRGNRMYLPAEADVPLVGDVDVRRLTRKDEADLVDLFARAHPGNYFEPRTLDTGETVGVRFRGRLIATAGVHVFSPARGVAAIGNVVTDRQYRRRGLARACVVDLCRSLRERVALIGLNVMAGGMDAIGLYRSLGFKTAGGFDEQILRRTGGAAGR